MHVFAIKRRRGGDRDRLLAGALHVEAGLPLPLGAVHAVVEHAHRDHVAQNPAQGLGVELGIPRADRLVIVAEDADEVGRERVGFGRGSRDIGPRRTACRGNFQRGEIGRVAGPERRLGHVQRELGRIPAQAGVPITH